MESERRGRGNKPNQSLTPGTFRPARPADSQGVVQLFAIAARAACAQPKNLSSITDQLAHACHELVSPELDAARECGRMWQLFAKVAELPKATLRLEAGRAFCRDLDALAQRLELPPLAEWVDLPEAMGGGESDGANSDAENSTQEPLLGLEAMQQQARKLLEQHVDNNTAVTKALWWRAIAKLFGQFEANARSMWLDTMVGRGVLSRTDVSLLIRLMAKGGGVQEGDTMLIEVLNKLLRALAEP